MGKPNPRLDAARKAYREALDAARKTPTPEAWARLLVAGKELSAAEDPPRSRRGRRSHQEPRTDGVDTPEHGETIEGLE